MAIKLFTFRLLQKYSTFSFKRYFSWIWNSVWTVVFFQYQCSKYVASLSSVLHCSDKKPAVLLCGNSVYLPVYSVVFGSLQPPGWQPTRLLCSWNFPGKSTGVGCHILFQGIYLIQGLNQCLLHLLHWQVDSLPLSLLGISCHNSLCLWMLLRFFRLLLFFSFL